MAETLAEQEPSLICRYATAANLLFVGRISLQPSAAEAETDKGPCRAIILSLSFIYVYLKHVIEGFIGHVFTKKMDLVRVHPAFATVTERFGRDAIGGSKRERPARRSTWA